MATFKLTRGLGMTVVLLGIASARLGFLYHVGAYLDDALLDDASSSGATTAPSSEQ
jgi:hypothetical protein